ncbi:MAG TPA: PQQ-binding-like beta-propeller repeat protein [Vicinamibacteria bacterium]|nr:PQQ-binding-like beta-propeller repeat protein [Vicinamibacteria bacterium]
MNLSAAVLAVVTVLWATQTAETTEPPAADPAEITSGAWSGTLSHDGETSAVAFEFEKGADGKTTLKITLPAMNVAHLPILQAPLEVRGGEVKVGPFAFQYDAAAHTLSGVMPEALVPLYRLPFTLQHVAGLDVPPSRPEPLAELAQPVWSVDAGSPLWAGPTYAEGALYFGGEDGQVLAVDARTGARRWSFKAGGPVRTRPTVDGGAVYLQADDGFLYGLAAADGSERWRVRVVEKPISRLPFDNPASRYDRFGSDVTVAGGRLYLGTHDGRVLAVEPGRGAVVWSFATGDSVLSAPSVAEGRVYAGSFDGHVYALDAASGRLAWKRDTRGAVVSTPAPFQDRLVVGNRSYDLLGLDARSGEVAWKRYIWFSWVESSATIRDGVAYLGSSDATAAFAFEARSGRPLWRTDVLGWAWGQPAVTAGRVYVATSSLAGARSGHQPGLMALERADGKVAWRYRVPAGASGPFGFPGSPATGLDLVFATGLDGRAYAFRR